MKAKKLQETGACREAVYYVQLCKTYRQAWNKCEKGDWMLWIAKKIGIDDKILTHAKYLCANQVRHLMKDKRSIAALDACKDYVKGKITRKQLDAYAAAAAADAYAYAAAADAAAYAAAAAAAADDAAYAAAADAAAADAAAYAAAAAAAAADDAAAYVAAADAAADAAAAAAYAAAAAAAAAADAAAYAAAADAAAYAAAYAAAAVKKESLKKSADICRKILTEAVFEIWNKIK